VQWYSLTRTLNIEGIHLSCYPDGMWIKRLLGARLLKVLLGVAMLSVALPSLSDGAGMRDAHAANPRYSPRPPIFVKLIFDGDVNFPSITSAQDTGGVGRFTGVNFDLNQAQRGQVVRRIREILDEKYKGLNVVFVTSTPPVASFFTWGIDDSTIVASNCNGPNGVGRIFGLAGAKSPTAADCDGNSIFFPRFARTFGGSFTRTGGSSPSRPALRLNNNLNGTPVTVEHIARALGNSAAHEIGHMFGLEHAPCSTDTTCQRTRIMVTMPEDIEATNDKVFDDRELDTMRAGTGRRPAYLLGTPGAATDTETGLMWTRNGQLPKSVHVAGATADVDGQLSYTRALVYAARLDYLGYDDWRLPSALEHDGSEPCSGLFLCDGSELGRKRLVRFLNPPFSAADNGLYWMNAVSRADPWYFLISAGQQGPASFLALESANVWPVRGARLIDNGDGTVTDKVHNLMWLRDPSALPTATLGEALELVDELEFAGYRDWRLPQHFVDIDETCTDRRTLTIGGPPGFDCQQNEAAFLFHGWGIATSAPEPFLLPNDGVPFWLDRAGGGFFSDMATYSFEDGRITRAVPQLRHRVLPVRRVLPSDLPPGSKVIVEPISDLLLRFKNVANRGTVAVTRLAPASFGQGDRFRINTGSSFESVVVCIRYDDSGLLGINESQRRIARNGVELDSLEGYPDSVNNIVCAGSDALGEFSLR
jgi:hypothetical protein